MVKTYGILGMTQCVISIPAGKATVRCEFQRGVRGAGAQSQPATYISFNPIEQSIIENSEMFRNGTIKLIHQYGEEPKPSVQSPKPTATKAPSSPKVEAPKEEPKSEALYPEVTSKEELVAVLKGLGAKATALASAEGIEKFIKERGLQNSFPNLVKE